MKISNETKVGSLTAIAITLFILGFNYLRGKSTFKTGNYVVAAFQQTKGIMVSNPVFINGFKVGSVIDIENADPYLKKILITIKLNNDYKIPQNSIATIKSNPLGSESIEITLGNSGNYLHSGDSITTSEAPGLIDQFGNRVDDISLQFSKTLQALEKTLHTINATFNDAARINMQQSLANINQTTANLAQATAALQTLLNEQNGSVTLSMKNVQGFTKNLADNNNKITQVITNLDKTTEQLAKTDLPNTVASLKTATDNLNSLLVKMNSNNGSLGALVNDKALYNNLNATIKSVNTLTDDLRLHPKRYVQVSVFGKKDKTAPLTKPVADTLIK